MKRKLKNNILICLLISVLMIFSLSSAIIAYADDVKTVRVGYYENEIFQEGAEDGTC